MTKIEDAILIMAPAESVWRVLSDPTYIPKLYQNAISIDVDPPGRVVVGQRCKILERVGEARVHSTLEITKVVKESRLESRGVPGGLFSSFSQTVTLAQRGFDTYVTVSFDYEAAADYAAKMSDFALLKRTLSEGFASYTKNLKTLSELIPLAE